MTDQTIATREPSWTLIDRLRAYGDGLLPHLTHMDALEAANLLSAQSENATRADAMQEAAAYCYDCADASEQCGATALAAAQRAMGDNLKARANG